MISKKYIKSLDFETIEDIYNYIVESEINGNYTQCKELINKLSTEQFKHLLAWCNDLMYMNDNYKEQLKLIYKITGWRELK